MESKARRLSSLDADEPVIFRSSSGSKGRKGPDFDDPFTGRTDPVTDPVVTTIHPPPEAKSRSDGSDDGEGRSGDPRYPLEGDGKGGEPQPD